MLNKQERRDIDVFIKDLYECKKLSENEIKFVCEKVSKCSNNKGKGNSEYRRQCAIGIRPSYHLR
jgi:hypothetical protein